MTASPQPASARAPLGLAFRAVGEVLPEPRVPRASSAAKPISSAYHSINWAGRDYRSSMDGMACSPATKWLSHWNYPIHPNLLVSEGAPIWRSGQTRNESDIWGLKPLVGMAGIDWLDSSGNPASTVIHPSSRAGGPGPSRPTAATTGRESGRARTLSVRDARVGTTRLSAIRTP